jgi:hypothetical protein
MEFIRIVVVVDLQAREDCDIDTAQSDQAQDSLGISGAQKGLPDWLFWLNHANIALSQPTLAKASPPFPHASSREDSIPNEHERKQGQATELIGAAMIWWTSTETKKLKK